MTKTQKLAVVAFNLGGPDRAEAIRPFLFNLFNDPSIIGLPMVMRTPLAWWIAKTRTPKVMPTYAEMGGASPILDNTQKQCTALQNALNATGQFHQVRVFPSMRYWTPLAEVTVAEVKQFAPDRVILLPLYPQMSTTTTLSYQRVWDIAARRQKLSAAATMICCYPTLDGFIQAQVDLIRPILKNAQQHGTPRILFSAHGLPQKIVDQRGDPYPAQVERSAAAMAARLADAGTFDWRVSYQSRVGRMAWVMPYTDAEIRAAGADKKPLVIVPLAFVSEHLETLVELDVEYRHLADEHGVPFYGRVGTVGTHPMFIDGLRDLVLDATQQPEARCVRATREPCCSRDCRACPHL